MNKPGRVKEELLDLTNTYFAGALFSKISRVLLDAALIAALVALAIWLLPNQIAQIVVSAFILLAGSFISTRRTPRRKFQHSALVLSLLIIVYISYALSSGLPGQQMALQSMLGFLAFFFGYRLAFKRK